MHQQKQLHSTTEPSSPGNASVGSAWSHRAPHTANSYNVPQTAATSPSVSEAHFDGSEAVRVVVRCRPMNDAEFQRSDQNVVAVMDERTLQLQSNGPGGRSKHRNYAFSHVSSGECQQQEFFETCGIKQLLESSLNGYAATVFAYGQTGSGKTYSMSGLEEQIAREEWSGGDHTDGIIPRSMRFIYDEIASARASDGDRYTVRASYCEIYNEQVFDLLNMSSGNLQVRWNVRNGFFVQDLFVVECEELADVMAVVSEGHRNRRVGSHELNKDSSRSHSILTVHLESESIDPDDGHTLVKFGKIVFVDLAGSERLKDTKSEGTTLTETGFYLEETESTLKYATRARSIKNKPMVQIDPKEQLIYNLRQEVKLLRMENKYLREQLKLQGGAVTIPSSPFSGAPSTAHTNGGVSPSRGMPPEEKFRAYLEQQKHTHQNQTGPGIRSRTAGSGQPASGVDVPIVRSTPPPGLTRNTVNGAVGMGPLPPGLPTPSNGGSRGGSRLLVSPRTTNTGGGGATGSALVGIDGSTTSQEGGSTGSFPQADLLRQQAGMQKILDEYQREIDRMKRENRELRAKGGVAERGYRAVMAENERLCSKLEHLEEIFVHQARQSPWPRDHAEEKGDEFSVENERLRSSVKSLQSENESLMKRVKMLESASVSGPDSGTLFRRNASTRKRTSSDQEQRDLQHMKSANLRLQGKIEQLQRREMALLRALETKQKVKHNSKFSRRGANEGKKK